MEEGGEEREWSTKKIRFGYFFPHYFWGSSERAWAMPRLQV